MALTDRVELARRLGWTDPLQIAASGAAFARWGPTVAGISAAAAVRHSKRVAVVDHRGSTTYGALDRESTRLAHGLRSLGLRTGDHLGILCFNHGGFAEATIAAAKAGLAVVYLNTGFAPRQLGEVVERERVSALVCDGDFLETVEASGYEGPVIVADGDSGGHRSLADVRIDGGRLRPSRPVNPVLLTSGTTGTPKGARREGRPTGLASAIGLLERIPYETGDVSVIPTPLFHAWGLAQWMIAVTTASTAVLVRRFTPDATLDAVEANRATVLAVVPIMLQRMLSSEDLAERDLSALRIVASSGSALPAQVATDWMDRSGENLYNMYGSTEVGQATLATPGDLRAAPGTAGRVVRGSTVRIVDSAGSALTAGEDGLIVVGNDAQFTGYTGGGTKETVAGLMSSGDVGHFDDDGRLFVTGRADDMIVSGGENVFPREVEDLLLACDEIADAAVYGVADDDFGQRLAATVVLRPGAVADADAIRAVIAGDLARHKVPRDIAFVDELPRNATGKLLRAKLTD
ncbi:MAG: AMP-binding protein [Acidimicrobiia bacterium]|nr:AMP-binding protein [Acidimicrobiia bacterium]